MELLLASGVILAKIGFNLRISSKYTLLKLVYLVPHFCAHPFFCSPGAIFVLLRVCCLIILVLFCEETGH